jgi:hypothetical protein
MQIGLRKVLNLQSLLLTIAPGQSIREQRTIHQPIVLAPASVCIVDGNLVQLLSMYQTIKTLTTSNLSLSTIGNSIKTNQPNKRNPPLPSYFRTGGKFMSTNISFFSPLFAHFLNLPARAGTVMVPENLVRKQTLIAAIISNCLLHYQSRISHNSLIFFTC